MSKVDSLQGMGIGFMSSDLVSRFVSRTTFASYEDFKENFRIFAPDNFNFGFDVVDYLADTDPDKTALVWCNDFGDEAILSFSDMKRLTNKAANFFLSRGIRKGDAVMLILGRRYEYWICLVALHKIGAISIPASHLLTARDISYRNNAADVKMIVASDEDYVLNAVDASEHDSPTLLYKVVTHGNREGWYDLNVELDKSSSDFARPTGPDATCNDDILLLYFTSGTTGQPKMVLHDHTYPLGHILTAKYWQNVQDNGLHLTVADTGWAKAGWGKIYGQWICGSAVFVYDYDKKFNAHNILRVLEKYRVTTFCGPATVYRLLVKENCSCFDLNALQYCVVAGEPLYPEVFNLVLDTLGLKIMEGFGQSETTVAIANYPWMEPKPGSMGKPSPGYDVDLVDENGNSVGIGEEGQIVFRMDKDRPLGMFREYYRSKELTDAAWHDGMYFTGDIAWRDEDGYFWYVGRCDDAIKSSGYKIGPFEVESALQEHPAVHECAVTGVPDAIRGQLVKATIVLSEGFSPSDALVVELQNHVKTITAPYKYPKIIEFADTLPKTVSGKICRSIIKKRDLEKHAAALSAKN